jgi:hypothetical protein
MNGPQRYNFDELREQMNKALLDKNMPKNLYNSTNGISRMLNAIIKTKGEGWTGQVVDENGNQLLSEQEQAQFTEAFKPYLDTILGFFGEDEIRGGAYEPSISKLSGLSDDFIKSKIEQTTNSSNSSTNVGIDDMYSKIIKKIGNVNSTVNNYASKYGILKLEKEHDLEPDIKVIPEAAALAISDGIFALSTTAGFPIPPNISLEVLSKIKIPFRLIVGTIYLILDIARISMGITGPSIGRKILSILVAVLEILRGDWKKSILTLIGFYGMMPMLVGQLLKVFLTGFRMLDPQIQESIIYGTLDSAKSFIIGFLLAIFQVTAPDEIRIPLIGSLKKIAQKKAEMDGTLEGIGLSARPQYLSPSWEDLNNIQAVMSDEAYICSCEFRDLVENVNKATPIKIILHILRIPVTKEMIEYKCGKEPCNDFATELVKKAKEDTEKKQEVNTEENPQPIKGGRILHSRRYKRTFS